MQQQKSVRRSACSLSPGAAKQPRNSYPHIIVKIRKPQNRNDLRHWEKREKNMTVKNMREQLESGLLDARLKEIYLTEDPAAERARVEKVLDMYESWFGTGSGSRQAVELVSSETKNGGKEEIECFPINQFGFKRLRSVDVYFPSLPFILLDKPVTGK
jgi:hypothetical protein